MMKSSVVTRNKVALAGFMGAALLASVLAGCGSSSGAAKTGFYAAKGCTKIGFLLPESDSSARWETNDHPAMVAAIQKYFGSNVTLDVTNANNNADTQASQAEADLTKGDCILIMAPQDAVKSAAIVESAKAQGVPVIAYDRLIQDKNTAFYVSFDNVAVGELQGQYVADHYTDYVTDGHNNLVMINGSQTDNNAVLFKQGAHEKIDPLVSSGALNLAYETFTPDWNNTTAQNEMDGALTTLKNNVSVAYVANDGMAGTVIASLKQQGLAGKVLVTGQDATVAGIQNILLGYQNMTVYKPIPQEADAAAQLAYALSQGTDTATLTQGKTTATTDGGALPSVLKTPTAVDKTNINDTVIKDGYVTKAEVCQGVPAGTDGVC